MVNLQGIAYRSGHIDFPKSENEWAFAKIESELKTGQERRIRFSPKKAPVEIRTSEVDEGELPWIQQARDTLQSADHIYVQLQDGYLRFRQAIHELSENRRFITLSSQEEVDSFAEKNWGRIRYFFAMRRDIVKFDMLRMITCKPSDEFEEFDVELVARVDASLDDGLRITFDSSGSKTDVHIVEWRSEVKEGERGKFFPDDRRIRLLLTQSNQPFTFLQEYRSEFKNHSYTFFDEKINKKLSHVIKKRLSDQEKALAEDSEAEAT